jgi:hypothetical protein
MDEFDHFVFHDALVRCGLKASEARAKVEHHRHWIHHAIVRLGYAQGDDELRAAQNEIEQDIRNIQARHGWDQQMMSAFHKRQQAALAQSSEAGSPRIPTPRVSAG